MNMPFEYVEYPQMLDLKERELFPIQNQGAIYHILNESMVILQQVLFSLGAIWIVGMLHPLIPCMIMGIILLNTVLYQKLQQTMYEFFQKLIPLNRRFGYYVSLTADFSMAKDIRLYNLAPLILRRIQAFNKESFTWFSKLNQNIGKFGMFNALMMQLQLLLVYGYMAFQVVSDLIGIGDFTMYINATTQFSRALSAIISNYVEVSQ